MYDLDFLICRRGEKSAINEYEAYYDKLIHAKPVRRVETPLSHDEETLHQLMAEAVEDVKASRDELSDYDKSPENVPFHRARVSFVHNQLNHVVKSPNVLKVLAALSHVYQKFTWVTPYEPIRNILSLNKDNQDITILTNSKKTSPNFPAFSATLAYAPFFNENSQLMSYIGDGSVHMKTILYGDHVTALGSFNLDPRSAFLNTETMAIIDSKDFQKDMRELLDSKDFVSWEEGKQVKAPLLKNILLWTLRVFQSLILPLV